MLCVFWRCHGDANSGLVFVRLWQFDSTSFYYINWSTNDNSFKLLWKDFFKFLIQKDLRWKVVEVIIKVSVEGINYNWNSILIAWHNKLHVQKTFSAELKFVKKNWKQIFIWISWKKCLLAKSENIKRHNVLCVVEKAQIADFWHEGLWKRLKISVMQSYCSAWKIFHAF